jgi:uncharacterized protein YcfJ
MQKKVSALFAALLTLSALSGCAIAPATPTGPSVTVLPGKTKSFDDFKKDDAQCRDWATQSIGGPKSDAAAGEKALGIAALGTALGAAVGAAFDGGHGAAVGAGAGLLGGGAVAANTHNAQSMTVQQRYDTAYVQCMFANHERVPQSAIH